MGKEDGHAALCLLFSLFTAGVFLPAVSAQTAPALPGPALSIPVDLDGDGVSTFGDLYAFNYWLGAGGSLSTALSHVIVAGATLDLSDFFRSSESFLDADLPPPVDTGTGTTSESGATRAAAGGAVIVVASGGGSQSATSSSQCPNFVRGDADDSGAVDCADTQFILDWLFGTCGTPPCPAPTCKHSADVNDDGVIDVSDPVFLNNHIQGGDPAPAPSIPWVWRGPYRRQLALRAVHVMPPVRLSGSGSHRASFIDHSQTQYRDDGEQGHPDR